MTGRHDVYAAQLREAFDHAFALPAQTESAGGRHLLAIRVGGHPYALDPTEIAGLHAGRVIVPVPGLLPEWLGLAGLRGGLVSVYSLSALLGHERQAAAKPRWLALCGGESPLGLAFDDFERHLNLSPSLVAAADPSGSGTGHIRATAQADGPPRPVISIASVTAEIARRCAATIIVSKEK